QTRAVPDWQRELAEAVRDPLELLSLLDLSPADLGPGTTLQLLTEAARDFPLRVPRGFVARMRRGDAADPLLRQLLAAPAELLAVDRCGPSPLDEAIARGVAGLLRKFAARVLLVATGACAVRCRSCFRRHFDYGAAA